MALKVQHPPENVTSKELGVFKWLATRTDDDIRNPFEKDGC